MPRKTIRFMDLRIQDPRARKRLLEAVSRVFRHGVFLLGPEVAELEKRVAARCGRKFAVGVSSGTDALLFTLKTFGVGPGDEVIIPALSWIATANAVAMAGARPVFADIGDDLNISPSSAERLITPRTKVLMPVHYTGKICAMEDLSRIARARGLALIEDASQAFGARRGGRPAGSFGDAACFSLNPMKVFAACGEAGIVLTDRADIAERLGVLRYNGMVNRETCLEPSLNGRLDTLQAALLLARLGDVDAIIAKRRKIAAWYDERLKGKVGTPRQSSKEQDCYYTYTIRTPERDRLKAFLEARGVEARVRDPYLMPEQPAYRRGAKGEFPNAKRLAGRLLCLPAHEKLSRSDVSRVCGLIDRFFEGAD
ncbi:MAG: DegT/DnrJ/EryC1/StrS family aminotransferase [Elusimicrobia bacterium]|nr:DegT/DnrJ/EryC1/StrS family aminotransferase [Elusimicrobiota bacterium]